MKSPLTAQTALCEDRGDVPVAAFTLTELLVVIATLTLLAATQLPALTRAKAPVKLTQCLNNCRRIGHATMLYKADNNDCFPYGNRCLGSGTGTGSVVDPYAWPLQLLRYLGGYQTDVQPAVYVCPSEHQMAYNWAFQLHYQANRYFVRDINYSDEQFRGSPVRPPAIYWVFLEKGPADFANIRPGGLSTVVLPMWNIPPGHPGYRRHNGGLTAVAADGHVEWLRLPLYQPGSPAPADLLELGECATGQPAPSPDPWPQPPNSQNRTKLFTSDCY